MGKSRFLSQPPFQPCRQLQTRSMFTTTKHPSEEARLNRYIYIRMYYTLLEKYDDKYIIQDKGINSISLNKRSFHYVDR